MTMVNFFISLRREIVAGNTSISPTLGHRAVWVTQGSLIHGGQLIDAGSGEHTAPNQADTRAGYEGAEILVFEVGRTSDFSPSPADGQALLTEYFDLQESQACLRLDQVTFPQDACAYRHTHPGPGIRYLVCGTLDIQADDHSSMKSAGDAWFEDANSPVKAMASTTETSSFVRAMILPVGYEGKSTIKILDPEDDQMPKLQTNKRFFDKRILL